MSIVETESDQSEAEMRFCIINIRAFICRNSESN